MSRVIIVDWPTGLCADEMPAPHTLTASMQRQLSRSFVRSNNSPPTCMSVTTRELAKVCPGLLYLQVLTQVH
jgi:hypothetical protein